eukprot:754964-Hanusia_phi.AAC.2
MAGREQVRPSKDSSLTDRSGVVKGIRELENKTGFPGYLKDIKCKAGTSDGKRMFLDGSDDLESSGSVYGSQDGKHEEDWAGIGIVMEATSVGGAEWKCIVDEIVAGSPADLCGAIQVGDVLLSVNDVMVEEMRVNEVVRLILGREGSNVKLEFRNGVGSYAVNLVRARSAVVKSTVCNICHSISKLSPSSSVHSLDSLSALSHSSLRSRDRENLMDVKSRGVDDWMAVRSEGRGLTCEGQGREVLMEMDNGVKKPVKESEEVKETMAEEESGQDVEFREGQSLYSSLPPVCGAHFEEAAEAGKDQEVVRLQGRLCEAEGLNRFYKKEIALLRSELLQCLEQVRDVQKLLEQDKLLQGRRAIDDDNLTLHLNELRWVREEIVRVKQSLEKGQGGGGEGGRRLSVVDQLACERVQPSPNSGFVENGRSNPRSDKMGHSPRRRMRLGAVNIESRMRENVLMFGLDEMIVNEENMRATLSTGSSERRGTTRDDKMTSEPRKEEVEVQRDTEDHCFDDFAFYKLLDELTNV